MQQTTTIPTVPVQTGIVIAQAGQPSRLNIPAIRGLGITQIVFGAGSMILGILIIVTISRMYGIISIGSGIWFGIWIVVTGIIGVCSARQPGNRALNGVNMGFNIVCTVVSFIVCIPTSIALIYYANCTEYGYNGDDYVFSSYCYNKSAAISMNAIYLILNIAEFFVSLTISIYCCKGTHCCATNPSGVLIQQPTSGGQIIVASSAAYPHQIMPSAYPPGSIPSYQSTMYQQGQMQPQGVFMQAPMGSATATTYSGDQVQEYQKTAPPPYSTAQ